MLPCEMMHVFPPVGPISLYLTQNAKRNLYPVWDRSFIMYAAGGGVQTPHVFSISVLLTGAYRKEGGVRFGLYKVRA